MDEYEKKRGRGILTVADRKYLCGERELSEGAEYNTRRRIRERTANALEDFRLLNKHLDPEDRRQIFDIRQHDDGSVLNGIKNAIQFIYTGMESVSGKFQPSFDTPLHMAIEDSERQKNPEIMDVNVVFEVDVKQKYNLTEAYRAFKQREQISPESAGALIAANVIQDEEDILELAKLASKHPFDASNIKETVDAQDRRESPKPPVHNDQDE